MRGKSLLSSHEAESYRNGEGGSDGSESRTAYSILKVAARAGVGRTAPEGASGEGEQADGPHTSSTANLSTR